MAMIFLIIKQFDWLKILIRFGTANQSVLFHARYSKVWILLRVVDRRRALERYFLFASNTITLWLPVWPDVGTESCPNFLQVAQKVQQFYSKSYFSKIVQKSSNIWATFLRKLNAKVLKITQSGHTAKYVRFESV